MADVNPEGRPPPQEDPMVAALVPDPSQGAPNAAILHGYLGRSTTEGVWRLYLSVELDRYVELPEDEILHTKQLPDDGGTLVWVRKDLALNVVRPEARQVQAEFLGGPIAGSRLRRAAPGGAAAAARVGPEIAQRVSVLGATCRSLMGACVSELCPSLNVRCQTRGLMCESVHVPCGWSVGRIRCSLGIACTVIDCPGTDFVGCGGASEVDACPSWICGPGEAVDPLL